MKRLIALTILMILSLPVAAEEVVLKCTTSEGHPTEDLRLDIENRKMVWGYREYSSKYDIYHVDDTYISAYEKPRNQHQVNGDVWVINRITGEYRRASAGIFYTKEDTAFKNGVLGTNTYSGTCGKQQF
jgi:SLT domain-containing protein